MTLKTATLCALIGMILNFLIGLYSFIAQVFVVLNADIPANHMIGWAAQLLLLNGSLILFFAVLYARQTGTHYVEPGN